MKRKRLTEDQELGKRVSYYIARKRQRQASEAARKKYFETVFRRDTPLPLPSVKGLTVGTVPWDALENLTHAVHRQLAELARNEVDLRMVGAGC